MGERRCRTVMPQSLFLMPHTRDEPLMFKVISQHSLQNATNLGYTRKIIGHVKSISDVQNRMGDKQKMEMCNHSSVTQCAATSLPKYPGEQPIPTANADVHSCN